MSDEGLTRGLFMDWKRHILQTFSQNAPVSNPTKEHFFLQTRDYKKCLLIFERRTNKEYITQDTRSRWTQICTHLIIHNILWPKLKIYSKSMIKWKIKKEKHFHNEWKMNVQLHFIISSLSVFLIFFLLLYFPLFYLQNEKKRKFIKPRWIGKICFHVF